MSETRTRRRKGEAALDWWSLAHFAAGLVLGLAPIDWLWAAVIIVGYEVAEAGLRRIKTEEGGLFEYESWPNIWADVLIGFLGYAVTQLAIRPFLPWPWELSLSKALALAL